MPPFPIFFSELFILLQLGAVSLWLLPVVLFLLFIAAAALGYFVVIEFHTGVSPGTPEDITHYKTPMGMKIPVVFLLVSSS